MRLLFEDGSGWRVDVAPDGTRILTLVDPSGLAAVCAFGENAAKEVAAAFTGIAIARVIPTNGDGQPPA